MKIIMMGCMLAANLCVAAEFAPVSPDQEKQWINQLIPLPHEITISNAVRLNRLELGVVLRPEAGPVERQAAEELRAALGQASDTRLPGPVFTVYMGVAGSNGILQGKAVPQFQRLQALPNKEQAYVIQPCGTNSLMVTALNEKGVYHGAQTMIQLLGKATNAEIITVPLAQAVDWPDFDERGLWNVNTSFVPMMSRVKLNFIRFSCPIAMDQEGHISAKVDTNFLAQAHARAVHGLVDLTHLNMWRKFRLFERYPQIVGQGTGAQNPKAQFRAPCASAPELQSIIRDWMLSAASQDVPEVCVWVSEEYGQCKCQKCRQATQAGEGQIYREVKAIYGAWQEARKQYPNLGLRVFTDLSYDQIVGYGKEPKKGEQVYEDILKLLPPEVKMDICIFSEQAKTFDAHAAKGRWFASYDGRIDIFPGMFSGPRIREKSQDIYRRKWRAMYGFGGRGLNNEAHDMQLKDYNVCALAEWTWNVNGRSLHEFSRAWTIRRGYADPEKAAAWIDAIEPIESVVGLGAFFTRRWEVVPALIREHNYDRIAVIKGMPGADKVAEIKKMSEQMAQPEIAAETGVIVSYIALMQSLNELIRARQAADTNTSSPEVDMAAPVAAFQTAVSNHVAAVAARTDAWLLPGNTPDATAANAFYRGLMEAMATNAAVIVMETTIPPGSGSATAKPAGSP